MKQTQKNPQTVFTCYRTQWNGKRNPCQALHCFQAASFYCKIIQFPEKKGEKNPSSLCLWLKNSEIPQIFVLVSSSSSQVHSSYASSYASIPHLNMGEDVLYRSSLQLLCITFQELHLRNDIKLMFAFHLGLSLQFQPLAGSSFHVIFLFPVVMSCKHPPYWWLWMRWKSQ